VRQLREAMPSWAVHDLDWTEQVIVDIHAAIAGGWTVADLAERITDHARGYYNADQVMRHRLHRAAHPDETTER
jgi:hypothetical protein